MSEISFFGLVDKYGCADYGILHELLDAIKKMGNNQFECERLLVKAVEAAYERGHEAGFDKGYNDGQENIY